MKGLLAAIRLARFIKGTYDPSKIIHSKINGIKTIASIPAKKRGLPVIALHGVTPEGENDPRILRFIYGLARSGLPAYAPRLEGMASGEVRIQDVDDITNFAKGLSDESGSQVGIVGFSVGGGYSLIAAADNLLKERLAFVSSIGGYAELKETVEGFFYPGPGGADENRWARLVVFNSFSSTRMLDQEDLEVIRRMVLLPYNPAREEEVLILAGELSENGKRIFQELMDRDGIIREKILGDLENTDLDVQLSPVKHLHHVNCPVYLLHGRHDPTISWKQTAEINNLLISLGNKARRYRISDTITHVQPEGVGKLGSWTKDLIFFADLLDHAFKGN